jgi:hypothetical protein
MRENLLRLLSEPNRVVSFPVRDAEVGVGTNRTVGPFAHQCVLGSSVRRFVRTRGCMNHEHLRIQGGLVHACFRRIHHVTSLTKRSPFSVVLDFQNGSCSGGIDQSGAEPQRRPRQVRPSWVARGSDLEEAPVGQNINMYLHKRQISAAQFLLH